MNYDETVSGVLSALNSLRAPVMSEEYDLHALIAQALQDAGLEFRHEYPLGPRRRIDFAVGRVGIEVKKGRPDRRLLMQQLARYLDGGLLDCVIVVCPQAVSLPEHIRGRRVIVLSLNRLWGVALP